MYAISIICTQTAYLIFLLCQNLFLCLKFNLHIRVLGGSRPYILTQNISSETFRKFIDNMGVKINHNNNK